MPLFPVFVNLKDKEVLVVGGGSVATRKVKTLLAFGPRITVVAPQVSPDLAKLHKQGKIKLRKRKFKTCDLRGKFAVIVAVDDQNLQREIFKEAQRRGILCNSVDLPEACSFFFASLITKGDLVIAVSTSGKVPALARALREKIERSLPENAQAILEELHDLRSSLPKGEERQKILIGEARKMV